ncbi:phosphonate metabolism protein/1,5-bisphosphokinase (PRPP-forming) PhnN [Paenochrobactrum sp. BZR 588]|uniref:phosphonate metabolism protein/1,5-bisphosphokinase (PRPP-forming) PhnN n=1 Tax=unclassified Paenochrobactrum TaxID=2639760 RepID=UPI003853C676
MQNENPKGCFIAVIGPSGAGKDTIMDAAREELKDDDRFHFVRRIITRPQMAGTEDHDSMDETAFAKALEKGAFALHWQAHGLHYALPRSLEQEIGEGAIVIANVSRRVLDNIRAAYPRRSIVMITARPEVLANRLASRGRETEQEIAARLSREVVFDNAADDVVKIDNSDDVTTAIEAFLRHLRDVKHKS